MVALAATAAAEPADLLVSVRADSRVALVASPAGVLKDRTRIQVIDILRENTAADYEAELNAVTAISVLPTGAFFATGHNDGTVTICKLGDGSLVRSWQAHEGPVVFSHSAMGTEKQGNASLLTTVSEDGIVRLWGSHAQRCLKEIELGFAPTRVAVAGRELVVALSPSGELKLVDLWSGIARGPLAETDGPFVDFVSAYDRLIVVARRRDGTLTGWRGESLTPFDVGAGSWGDLRSMAILPRGQQLILLREDNQLVFIDLPTQVEIDRWREDLPLRSLVAAPDARWLLLVGASEVRIINPRSEDRQENLKDDGQPEILLF
jgi:dipeptidyl aminopeptidase/acylaminoacyl peptidase